MINILKLLELAACCRSKQEGWSNCSDVGLSVVNGLAVKTFMLHGYSSTFCVGSDENNFILFIDYIKALRRLSGSLALMGGLVVND